MARNQAQCLSNILRNPFLLASSRWPFSTIRGAGRLATVIDRLDPLVRVELHLRRATGGCALAYVGGAIAGQSLYWLGKK